MGFKVDQGENGRPAYHPKDLLKLYLYGYMNRMRSSRELEKETKRNIEAMWLMKSQQRAHKENPNYYRRRQAIVEHPNGRIKKPEIFGRDSVIS